MLDRIFEKQSSIRSYVVRISAMLIVFIWYQKTKKILKYLNVGDFITLVFGNNNFLWNDHRMNVNVRFLLKKIESCYFFDRIVLFLFKRYIMFKKQFLGHVFQNCWKKFCAKFERNRLINSRNILRTVLKNSFYKNTSKLFILDFNTDFFSIVFNHLFLGHVK